MSPKAFNLSQKHPLEQIVENGLCIGCGFCHASFYSSDADVKIKMAFDSKKDFVAPDVMNWNPDKEPGDFICPGAQMDLIKLSEQVHNKIPNDYMLGVYKKLRVCYSTDEINRKESASGGVIFAVLKYLLSEGRADIIYCAEPGDGPYKAQGRVIRDIAELGNIHGSIYHPVNFGKELHSLIKGKGRFVFVGLPCQIAGLEMLKSQNSELANLHILSLGLFCGGINTFQGIAYYLRGFGIKWSDVDEISYRYGPWPGKIKVSLKSSGKEIIIPRVRENTRWKILRYAIAFQGYWMLKRCRLCFDQISDFADIAVGDPHLPKYRIQDGAGFSAVISRTDRGEKIIQELIQEGLLGEEDIDRGEVIRSQGYTLDNRRHASAYMKVVRFFGGEIPDTRVYVDADKTVSMRHYIYAVVDMMKVAMPKNKFIQVFYIPWQIFEYLFITFAPLLIIKRTIKIFRNR